jgi:hypothetical protein
MFDINKVEADAKAEIAKEQAERAKKKVVAKLREIAAAKQVVANLEGDYAVILREIGTDVG